MTSPRRLRCEPHTPSSPQLRFPSLLGGCLRELCRTSWNRVVLLSAIMQSLAHLSPGAFFRPALATLLAEKANATVAEAGFSAQLRSVRLPNRSGWERLSCPDNSNVTIPPQPGVEAAWQWRFASLALPHALVQCSVRP